MAAPMEPDINPKNTDRHATTYSPANKTSSLKQTSADPVWEFASHSEYRCNVFVNKYNKTVQSEVIFHKNRVREGGWVFWSKGSTTSGQAAMKSDISIHGSPMTLSIFSFPESHLLAKITNCTRETIQNLLQQSGCNDRVFFHIYITRFCLM